MANHATICFDRNNDDLPSLSCSSSIIDHANQSDTSDISTSISIRSPHKKFQLVLKSSSVVRLMCYSSIEIDQWHNSNDKCLSLNFERFSINYWKMMIVDNKELLEIMENEKEIYCFERQPFDQVHNQYQSADSFFFRTLIIIRFDSERLSLKKDFSLLNRRRGEGERKEIDERKAVCSVY